MSILQLHPNYCSIDKIVKKGVICLSLLNLRDFLLAKD